MKKKYHVLIGSSLYPSLLILVLVVLDFAIFMPIIYDMKLDNSYYIASISSISTIFLGVSVLLQNRANDERNKVKDEPLFAFYNSRYTDDLLSFSFSIINVSENSAFDFKIVDATIYDCKTKKEFPIVVETTSDELVNIIKADGKREVLFINVVSSLTNIKLRFAITYADKYGRFHYMYKEFPFSARR